jgi:hypothetical protein
MTRNTIVLTEQQRSLLGAALAIARDKFASNSRLLREKASDIFVTKNQLEVFLRLSEQFDTQSEQTWELAVLFIDADHIVVETEEE